MKTTRPPSISIVLVNYNTPDLTLACVRSIYNYPPEGEFEIIVVDNDSHDNSVSRISQEYPNCVLIESKVNLGFSGGNNLGLQIAKYNLLVLLNSDTEVHQNALVNLQNFLLEKTDAAVVGGKHFMTNGDVQPTIKYFPNLRNKFSEALFLHHFFNGRFFSEHETRIEMYDTAQEVEWLSGSYLAVRREWYERIGGLDDGFFMYAEDTDWCYRIYTAGGELGYYPDSVITHHCGGSSGASDSLSTELVRSRDRYARLHLGQPRACMHRLGMSVELVVRFVVLTISSLVSRKSFTFAKERIKALIALHGNPLPKHSPFEK